MFSLAPAKTNIQNLIVTISRAINIDMAVFDEKCSLLVSTDKYIKLKGNSVHTPSIREVLDFGNVLVNKPGYMPSCLGCRFNGNCPSTIEVLSSIKIENKSVGVLSLTSFTKEGQERITQNIDMYLNILNGISELIISFALQYGNNYELFYANKTINAIMDLSGDGFITTDREGRIMNYNAEALKLFPICSINDNRINNIFPEGITDEILGGKTISERTVKTGGQNILLSVSQVASKEEFEGSIIKLEKVAPVKEGKRSLRSNSRENYIDKIIGESTLITEIKERVKMLSGSKSTVLITGETGTGKELFAKAIHFSSSRADNQFISINCASIPETLFESELFGYEEGAFTGARRGGKPGKFELAQGGTLFLDEIGEMPMYVQAKLLRVLQEQVVERIGGVHPISVDVRIIAATNQNLEEMVRKKEFRADLFYRLNVIPVVVPELRNRYEDLERLAGHFLLKHNERLDKNILGFSEEIIPILQSYNWPGNVRELENTIEYAVNMERGNIIGFSSLPDKFRRKPESHGELIKPQLRNAELDLIRCTLDKYGWDLKGKEKAAKELGIGIRTLYRKISGLKE